MKNTKSFVLILFIVIIVYVLRKMGEDNASKLESKKGNGGEKGKETGCLAPDFPDVIVNVADCRGGYVDEGRELSLGNWGCDVVVLQQRLNMLEHINILQPTGKFDCLTLEKLERVKGVKEISLNDFSPDEQIGLDTLRPANVYSTQRYMDLK